MLCFRLFLIFFLCKFQPFEGRFFLRFLTKYCADKLRPFFDEHGTFERLQAMAFKSSKWSNDRWPGNYYPSSEAPEEIAPPSKQFSLLNRFSPTSRRSIKGQNLDDFHNWSLERKSQFDAILSSNCKEEANKIQDAKGFRELKCDIKSYFDKKASFLFKLSKLIDIFSRMGSH